jgi:hypothetical protein
MNGGGGTGEVVDLVDLDIKWKAHIVAQELESPMVQESVYILAGAGVEIVDAQDLVALLLQALA